MSLCRYCVGDWLPRIQACPHRFGRKGSKINYAVARLVEILCELRENIPCCDPVLESESWDVRQQRMEDSSVGLERLLECEVAQDGRVNMQCHCACGRVYTRGIGAKMRRCQGAIRSCPIVSGQQPIEVALIDIFIRVRINFIFYNY